MAVDRLSVTVPSELGAALRALAEARGTTVSTVVTEAIALEVRLAELDRALAEASRRFGPISDDLVETMENCLLSSRSSRPSRTGRRKQMTRSGSR